MSGQYEWGDMVRESPAFFFFFCVFFFFFFFVFFFFFFFFSSHVEFVELCGAACVLIATYVAVKIPYFVVLLPNDPPLHTAHHFPDHVVGCYQGLPHRALRHFFHRVV